MQLVLMLKTKVIDKAYADTDADDKLNELKK